MKRCAYLLVAAVLLMAGPVLAQQEQGDSELQFQGSLFLGISGDAQDSGAVQLIYGRFLTDKQEVGGTVGAFINSNGDWAGVGGPFYRYNFVSSGKLIPYAGAAATTTFGEYAGGDVLLNLEGGFRYFVNRSTAFTVAGSYQYDVDASDFADYLQVFFGFSYVWNK